MYRILLYIVFLITHNLASLVDIQQQNPNDLSEKSIKGFCFNLAENYFAILDEDTPDFENDDYSNLSTSSLKLINKESNKENAKIKTQFINYNEYFLSKFLIPYLIDIPPPDYI